MMKTILTYYETPFFKYEEKNNKTCHIKEIIDDRSIEPKRVIFNDPATIVFWSDGDKTIVKATGEPYDPEKGLAMCIAKKSFGNNANYYEVFKKWLPADYQNEKEE